MGGFVGFLKFVLLCSDCLAWPVFALVYPLCASIRAIETGSKYHIKKLVIYWILFSLLSLFEIAFFMIIERIPYWSGIKLIVICSLVVPRFDGACYVYDCLVHPCLSLDIQAIMSTLYKTKENKLVNTETFLDVENGSEALEKLIAAPTSEKPEEQKAEASLKEANHAQPNLGTCADRKSDAPVDIKEMAPPNSKTLDGNHPESPVKNVKRRWKRAIRLVTTTSEKNVNDHLLGDKHKSTCEPLKISRNTKEVTAGSSPLMKDKSNNAVKKPTAVLFRSDIATAPKYDGATTGPKFKLLSEIISSEFAKRDQYAV